MQKGIRKTIYVPSQEVWNRVKKEASKRGLSVSQYLLGGEVKPIPVADISPQILENLAYIRDQIDKLCGMGSARPAQPEKFESHRPIEKPKKVIKTVEDIPVWAGGYSKAQQVGKKAKN